MTRRNKINGNDLGNSCQAQAAEVDEEQEQNECQSNVGLLELASRAILLVIQDGIGVKKIDEGDKDKKIEQVDKNNFPGAGLFHEL